jgi:hypothetical protein
MFIPEDAGGMIAFPEWTEGIAKDGDGFKIGGQIGGAVQSGDQDGKTGMGQFNRRLVVPRFHMRICKGGQRRKLGKVRGRVRFRPEGFAKWKV